MADAAPGKAPAERQLLTMSVKHIMLDPRNQTPVVILESGDGEWNLPIWIGPYEASSIIMALEKVEFPRPLTHDLILNAITSLEGLLERVLILRVEDATFFAELEVRHEGRIRRVDARPSDAIALALRVPCPILAERTICETAGQMTKFLEDLQAEQYRTFLEGLDPQDISKYRM